MAGSKAGGKAAATTNKKEYGDDFYVKIGAIGGKRGRTGGFAAGKEGRQRARLYGSLGGRLGTRSRQNDLDQKTRQRIRKEFERTHAHLLKIHEKANV